jgi:hypothetical protein
MKLIAREAAVDPPPSGQSSAERLFTALYAGHSGILELRTVALADTEYEQRIAARYRQFVPVHDGRFDQRHIDRFLKNTGARRMAAYFGVALRKPEAARDRKGTAAYCQTLTTLFVDADFKRLGEEETRRRIDAFAITPSAIVNSGGGLHAYWFLRPALALDTPNRLAEARVILRRLAIGVADVADVAVSEPARVLRIPGSFNFKPEYDAPRPVVLERG